MYICSDMNKALLSIGTNQDREDNLALCHDLLNRMFSGISYSKTSVTAPYGDHYKADFLNQLALVYTDQEKEEVLKGLKWVESRIGREKDDKEKGIVKIDVDLVIWNDEVLKLADLGKSYIADLLKSFQD